MLYSKKTLVILLVILISFAAIAILYLSLTSSGKPLRDFATPTPYIGGGEGKDAIPGMEGPMEAGAVEEKNKQNAVYKLVTETPHVGNNFAFYYSFGNDLFIVYINPQQKEQGEAEFNSYLKEKGVMSRSWINNLFTTYISPTPTPNQDVPTPGP